MNTAKTLRIATLSVAMALVATVSSMSIFADDSKTPHNVTPLEKVPDVGEPVDADNNAETNPDRTPLKQECYDYSLPAVCCEPVVYNNSEACISAIDKVFAAKDSEIKKNEQKKTNLEKQLKQTQDKARQLYVTGIACDKACDAGLAAGGSMEDRNACINVCAGPYPEFERLVAKAQKQQAEIDELDAKIKKAASDSKEIQAKTGIKAKKSTVKKPIKKKTRIFRPVEGANRQSTPGTK